MSINKTNLQLDSWYKYKTNKGDIFIAKYLGEWSGGLVFRFSSGYITIYDSDFITILEGKGND